jgi:hypothetical protein
MDKYNYFDNTEKKRRVDVVSKCEAKVIRKNSLY